MYGIASGGRENAGGRTNEAVVASRGAMTAIGGQRREGKYGTKPNQGYKSSRRDHLQTSMKKKRKKPLSITPDKDVADSQILKDMFTIEEVSFLP